MKPLAALSRTLPRSGIRQIMELASRQKGVIHLEVGDPTFSTPLYIVEAASRAAHTGYTHYTPNAGFPELRELIAEKIAVMTGASVAAVQVVVTPGSVTALYTSMLALADRGEEVLLPELAWPNFEQIVLAVGAVPVRYRLDRSRGFQPDLDHLRTVITPKTKVLLVNSPGNPTGAVFSAATARELADIAAEHDLFVVADECYEKIVFDTPHVSIAEYAGFDRTIVIQSFSKTYAMTGWRVGYAVASQSVAETMARFQEPLVSCASAISQKAAEAALKGPRLEVENMRASYHRRRDLVVRALRGTGLLAATPEGSFYALLHIGAAAGDTITFAKTLLADCLVAVAPGETFGAAGAGLIRISLTAEDDVLEEGIGRLITAISKQDYDRMAVS